MKIIDKNMLKVAEDSLRLSRNKYAYEKTNGEVIVFSNGEIVDIKRINRMFTTDIYDADNKVRHPNIHLLKEDQNYQDFRFSELIYNVEMEQASMTVEINVPYAHNLSTLQAKNSSVFVLIKDLWVELETVFDKEAKLIKATFNTEIARNERVFTFAVFSNYFWYSSYTKPLAENFPTWSYLHKNKESNGQRFLNFFGIELEELQEHFKWINDQHFIGTADLTQLDWVHVYGDGNKKIEDTDKVFTVESALEVDVEALSTVKEFLNNTANEGVLIDYDKGIIYSQYEYDLLYIRKVDGSVYQLNKRLHLIWNTYDEFGLLLGVKRIYGEKNYRFIERILDVFRYPSNTTELGLTHGIARDLDMIQRYSEDPFGKEIELKWNDDTKPLLIRNKSGMMLDYRTLRVDGNRKLSDEQYEVDTNNNIIIHPLNEYTSHRVSIIQGIEKYELHNKEDEKLYGMMYRDNGLATPLLESWVAYIKKIAPVMWDDFQWDKGYWDTIDKELTGVGYVPNHWDSSIEKWKGYYVYE